ncbi:MAG: methionine--tRNA ligase [Candidatus Paceibacterota bacterium]|jgi:methionyl-tRNA synthetase
MKKTFYITTTLPYVNSDPHVGFAMEIIRADVIARYKKLMGYEVFFNTGTDEHGQKLFTEAEKAGISVKEYVDGYAEKFKNLKSLLGISDDVHFIRTTDTHHEKAAQAFWKLCENNGFIYKGNYQTKYCVGCELEKTDSELVDGVCPIHPNRAIELINEENYFFKYSAFQDKLTEFYSSHPDFVVPDFRFNEIKSFVNQGLQDFSISRQKSKMSWGIPVPGDEDHVMYVWFDALVNYVSTLGWPEDSVNFDKFWKEGTPVQYCGKDNLRQQSAMWQAMLMAAGLPQTSRVIVNGFITGDGGIKMSKSLGNVINPVDIVSEYGTDALRFFLLGEVSSFEDSPFTLERFKEVYNSQLANGIGNLTSRIMKMSETYGVKCHCDDTLSEKVCENLEQFNIKSEMDDILAGVKHLDEYIQQEQPFKKIKIDEEGAKKDVQYLLGHLFNIALRLSPFIPETSEKIISAIKANKMPESPLFLRKD